MNNLKQFWPSYKITIRIYVMLASLKKKPKKEEKTARHTNPSLLLGARMLIFTNDIKHCSIPELSRNIWTGGMFWFPYLVSHSVTNFLLAEKILMLNYCLLCVFFI